MRTTVYTIDAKGKSLGRVASAAATLLLGKGTPNTKKHLVADVSVSILNAAQLAIPEKKLRQKTYHSHSGYLGGDKKRSMRHLAEKQGPEEIIRRAVKGMLPTNTLREKRLKRLIIRP